MPANILQRELFLKYSSSEPSFSSSAGALLERSFSERRERFPSAGVHSPMGSPSSQAETSSLSCLHSRTQIRWESGLTQAVTRHDPGTPYCRCHLWQALQRRSRSLASSLSTLLLRLRFQHPPLSTALSLLRSRSSTNKSFRRMAGHCTLPPYLRCSLYGRQVDLLPIEFSEAPLRSIQSARLSLMTAVARCEAGCSRAS